GVLTATAVMGFMMTGSLIRIEEGTYDLRYDLPLFLCRIVAWILPFAMLKKNRFWLGIMYFWVLAGTFQGLVTPDLAEGFPGYFYFRYWFLHAGLVVSILYAVIVFRIRIRWTDFWREIGLTQVYLILIHPVNLLLKSNYSYTVQKPPKPTILDLFGPWPWYFLGAEALMIVFFVLLMLPWLGKKA